MNTKATRPGDHTILQVRCRTAEKVLEEIARLLFQKKQINIVEVGHEWVISYTNGPASQGD